MFNENLKTIRKAKGYTQEELSANGKKDYPYQMQIHYPN